MKTGKPVTVEMYIRLLPGSPLSGYDRGNETQQDKMNALRVEVAGACWGDELIAPPWNGQWSHRASLEQGAFSQAETERFEFRDAQGRTVDEDRYRALCDDIRVFWQISLLESYPGLPPRQLESTLRDARFHYSRKYGAVVGSFLHTGLDEYKAPRKPGLLERLFSRKGGYYDKTLCLFIAAFGDLNPSRILTDPKVRKEILNSVWVSVCRAHYLMELRPPVKWNYHYTLLPVPGMSESEKIINQFWDDETLEITHKDRYRLMCDNLRSLLKESLVKEFPDYDREKLEDGLERIAYDYDPAQGTITASMVLDRLMPLKKEER